MLNNVIIVAFTEPKDPSYRFNKWPNHITLLPYFQVEDLKLLKQQLMELSKREYSFSYTIGKIDYFGGERKVKVSKIQEDPALTNLHKSLLKIALTHDTHMDTALCHPNYKPHITHNHEPFPQENETNQLLKVYLIRDLYPAKKDKEVIEIFELNSL